ncbi:MAG: hypothetical protein P8127_14240, partial [Acidobacteriota bacterium]
WRQSHSGSRWVRPDRGRARWEAVSPGASIYPSSGPRRWLPTPDGHRLPPLCDLIAAHDPTTRKSDFLLN